MTLRISTTTIEHYRRVMETEYAKEAELIDQIRGAPWQERWQSQAGTAFHRILEKPDHIQWVEDFAHVGGFIFHYDDAQRALEGLRAGGVRECKTTREVRVEGEDVTLVAKCDRIIGSEIEDHKCKFSHWSPMDYDASLQWRYYLWAFQASKFIYRMYSFREPEENGLLRLKDVTAFAYWPYADLEDDCLEWLGGFIRWARLRRLLPFLASKDYVPREREPEAAQQEPAF